MKSLNQLLNRHVLSAIVAAPLLLANVALADEAPAAEAAPAAAAAPAEPAPPYTFTFNLGVTTNYISRGINNSSGPAVQGGADLAFSNGFYLGTWFSSVNPQNLGAAGFITFSDPAGNPLGRGNHVETDWYGGYSHAFGPVTVGIGGNYVWYPEYEKSYHNRLENTFEGNVNVSAYGFTYTFYHAFTDWYGIGRTRPTGVATIDSYQDDTSGVEYHELKYGYTLPFADLNLTTKVGYQRSSDICLNQKDFAIGLNRNFSLPSGGKPIEGFNAGASYSGTFGTEQCAVDGAYYTDDNGVSTIGHFITFYIKRTW